jgi:hypothetical protein
MASVVWLDKRRGRGEERTQNCVASFENHPMYFYKHFAFGMIARKLNALQRVTLCVHNQLD